MVSMKKWMLGVALAMGVAGLGATTAQAAQVRVYVGAGPAAYIPPCPGPGYFWVAGYYSGGYWIPGRWDFRGVVGRDYDRGRMVVVDRDHNRGRDLNVNRNDLRLRDHDGGRPRR